MENPRAPHRGPGVRVLLLAIALTASLAIALLALTLRVEQESPPAEARQQPRQQMPQQVSEKPTPQSPSAVPSNRSQPPVKADWSEIARLVSEQKYEAASKIAEALRRDAETAGNQEAWARALITEVQLRSALQGYETAVRFLKEERWPKGRLARATLDLFYATALTNYLRAYSYEVNQRERVESRGAIDLNAWSSDQIAEEM